MSAGAAHRATQSPGLRPAGRLVASWRLLAGTATSVTAGLGLLMLACVLVAMAGPRAAEEMQTNALRTEIARAGATTSTIEATYGEISFPGGSLLSDKNLTEIGSELRLALPGLPLARQRTDLAAVTSSFLPLVDGAPGLQQAPAQLELVYATRLSENARFAAGGPPGVVTRAVVKSKTYYFLPVAVTSAVAKRYGLSVGTEVPFGVSGGNFSVQLRVAGIMRPIRPAGPFWDYDPTQGTPDLVTPLNGAPYWQAGAFVSKAEIGKITSLLAVSGGSTRWVLPLNDARLTATQGKALATSLPLALGQDGNNLQDPPIAIALFSPLSRVLQTFVQQANAVTTLLALLSVSLTAICATVLLLTVWLLSEQRREEFTTLQARGASRRQLAWVASRACLPPVAVGTIIGLATAIAVTPGGGNALSWWLSALTVASVLAGVPLITTFRFRAAAVRSRRQRSRTAARSRGSRRLVVEGTLVLVAAGGILTLRSQGLSPGSVDLYPSLTPVLIAIPVALVVLRSYPPLTRPVLQLTGRRRGMTAFVGLARAVRAGATSALPVFALVLALTLVAFAGMVRAAVQRGDVAASFQQVGGDALIQTSGTISLSAQRSLARVPGVQRTAAVGVVSATYTNLSSTVGVVAVDPAQYAAVFAGVPGLADQARSLAAAAAARPGGQARIGSAAFPVPILAPAPIAAKLQRPGSIIDVGGGGQPVHVRVVGQVMPVADIAEQAGQEYIVLPAAVLGSDAPAASILLVRGASVSQGALTRAVAKNMQGAALTFRAPVLAQLLDAPLQHSAYTAFALGSGEAAVLSLLVLLITLVIGARPRELTLARLATMGMSAGQGRSVVMLEALPQILATVAGGVACAAALAPLIGPELDLSGFTGTAASVPVQIEPSYLVGACAGLLLLAILTLTVQTRIAIRGTASALRIGD
ncbi:MAG TPA: FtsX-like permease family protein [Streptosporangiaceae bacterium]